MPVFPLDQGQPQRQKDEQGEIGHTQHGKAQAQAGQKQKAPFSPAPQKQAKRGDGQQQKQIVIAQPPDISPGIAQHQCGAQKGRKGLGVLPEGKQHKKAHAPGKHHIEDPGKEIDSLCSEEKFVDRQHGIKDGAVKLHGMPLVQNQLLAVPEPLGEGQIKALIRPAETIQRPDTQASCRHRQQCCVKGNRFFAALLQGIPSRPRFPLLYTFGPPDSSPEVPVDNFRPSILTSLRKSTIL